MIFLKDRYAYILTRNTCVYIILFIFASCTQKKVNDGEFSEEFQAIAKNTERLWSQGKVKPGLDYLDSAFNKLPNPTLNDRYRFYGFHFVYYQKTVSQFERSLAYTDSMIAINNKITNTKAHSRNVAEVSFARGDALFELKQYSEAYESYYRGYYIGRNRSNINAEALGDYTYRMGMIMYKKGQYPLALSYFKDTYKNFKNSGDGFVLFYRRQELLDNVGLCFRHMGQPDSALTYFNKALAFIDKNGFRYPDRKLHLESAKGVVYGNIADIYIKQKKYAQAADLLKKSIAINLKPGYDNHDAELTEIKLGQIYLNLDQKDLLLNLLAKIRTQLDTVKNDDAEADYNRLLGNYYERKNDLKQALAHIQKYNLLKDSIAQRASILMQTDVNQQLSNYEKQHEINILSNDNKLQAIYLCVSVFFAAMALIIVFLVYRNWTRSKQDLETVNLLNRQINDQNHVLEKAFNELNTSSQEKDRILRTVAHDLRNPIGGIASLTTMMSEDDYTAEQKELINLLKETSFNSLELINEILEATNMNAIALNLEQIEINSLVSNSVELLRFKAAEKGQKILLDILNMQQELYISREKIWRVISNLISNAIKFSPTGGEIQVKIAEVNGKIIIAVQDHGIGIPDTLKDEVFNMFTTAQRLGTSGEKSYGLGLSICRQIMEKHYGKIWFESESNIGSTFFISLPIISRSVPTDLPKQVSEPMA
ncbi:tetratricopeptide repeat-containing sensor histidine kinase [Mucilaginibacter sp. 10I4]|uniref:tetratricopeptide repeat-containing sensor histidine kinase n=1 Tax=Mucilaginibacter sp. 10I4 TaxID=3048580 RepID=UPI002B224B7C|nr:tetratricopeptide repeat-containing sensor histidine kinase [Mucilaginibacter sp. 10I4]MEB0261382.1 tetratricopeptide repeat-containing sensor histidine kinase [Mucilaginibacter sp. 10I4]